MPKFALLVERGGHKYKVDTDAESLDDLCKALSTELKLSETAPGFEVENEGQWSTPSSLADVKEKQKVRVLKKVLVIVSFKGLNHRINAAVSSVDHLKTLVQKETQMADDDRLEILVKEKPEEWKPLTSLDEIDSTHNRLRVSSSSTAAATSPSRPSAAPAAAAAAAAPSALPSILSAASSFPSALRVAAAEFVPAGVVVVAPPPPQPVSNNNNNNNNNSYNNSYNNNNNNGYHNSRDITSEFFDPNLDAGFDADTFVPQSAECECCQGYPYGCACVQEYHEENCGCVLDDSVYEQFANTNPEDEFRDTWFPFAKDCQVCFGYRFKENRQGCEGCQHLVGRG